MAYEYGDDNQLRLAEVIFTQRMSAVPKGLKAADLEKIINENTLLSLEASLGFSHGAEGWFDTKDQEPEK